MKEAVLIYPHQLFKEHPLITKERCIFLIEEPLLFTQYSFHKQKLLFHRASMRAYQHVLEKRGHVVTYVESAQISKTEDIVDVLREHNITSVHWCDVVDDWLTERLTKALDAQAIPYSIHDTPLFLTSKESLDSFFLPLLKRNQKFQMKTFYQWQRKRLDILIEKDGSPTGGSWSYDAENRKKLPKGLNIPPTPAPTTGAEVEEAREYVEKHFPQNYGQTDSFFYPITHADAEKWLADFLTQKLDLFGPYEDALTTKSGFLFHSVLSPLINAGLLTPEYVIRETIAYSKTHAISLASLEGFIRQIIGWREYMRAVYVYLGRKERSGNYFGATRTVPKSFWTGTTGILPVDDTITTSLAYAYAHHIPRLMVMGNFMNLCGFAPHEVYLWFMEMYIDAYDWVMVPNVYSMALYADGGLITTKPYISSSNYVLGMSDYKKGEWSEVWDALFWHFVGMHFDALSKEGRLGFIGITYQKMSPEKKEGHDARARAYLQSLE